MLITNAYSEILLYDNVVRLQEVIIVPREIWPCANHVRGKETAMNLVVSNAESVDGTYELTVSISWCTSLHGVESCSSTQHLIYL